MTMKFSQWRERVVKIMQRVKFSTGKSFSASSAVNEAIQQLRLLDFERGVLLHAARIAVQAEGNVESAIHAFCEDYNLHQVDPVKRIDVLKHALSLIREATP